MPRRGVSSVGDLVGRLEAVAHCLSPSGDGSPLVLRKVAEGLIQVGQPSPLVLPQIEGTFVLSSERRVVVAAF